MAGEADLDVRIGISACLVGQAVRYDGRHKRDPYVTGELAGRLTWVPVCPELDIGLGVPREPVHLVAESGDVRLVGVRSGDDHTAAMRSYAERRTEQLASAGLDGYVLKSRSPSCGPGDIPVHDAASGEVVDHDRGRFAAVLADRLPLLPVTEETRLSVPDDRDRFLERACVRHRWRGSVGADPEPAQLVAFHRRHEMQVLAHSPDAHRRLGELVADTGPGDLGRTLAEYRSLLDEALQEPPTRGRHVHVLQHLAGMLGPSDDEVRAAIERYADARSAWLEPVEAIRAALATAPAWVREQTYLDPLAEVGLLPSSW